MTPAISIPQSVAMAIIMPVFADRFGSFPSGCLRLFKPTTGLPENCESVLSERRLRFAQRAIELRKNYARGFLRSSMPFFEFCNILNISILMKCKFPIRAITSSLLPISAFLVARVNLLNIHPLIFN